MPSKTPTKAKNSTLTTIKLKPSSKPRRRATKKKRASTSSKQRNAQAKPALLETADWSHIEVTPAKLLEPVRRLLSEKVENPVLTSEPTYSRRGLYDGITIESIATSGSFAESARTHFVNSLSPGLENAALELPTSAKLPDGLLSTPLSDTSSHSERRSFVPTLIKGVLICFAAAAFLVVLVNLVSSAA